MTELKRWKCHKVIQAARIIGLDPEDRVILDPQHVDLKRTFADRDECQPPKDWYDRFRGKKDGYYVIYEDGYTSWSPAEAFESGYSEIA